MNRDFRRLSEAQAFNRSLRHPLEGRLVKAWYEVRTQRRQPVTAQNLTEFAASNNEGDETYMYSPGPTPPDSPQQAYVMPNGFHSSVPPDIRQLAMDAGICPRETSRWHLKSKDKSRQQFLNHIASLKAEEPVSPPDSPDAPAAPAPRPFKKRKVVLPSPPPSPPPAPSSPPSHVPILLPQSGSYPLTAEQMYDRLVPYCGGSVPLPSGPPSRPPSRPPSPQQGVDFGAYYDENPPHYDPGPGGAGDAGGAPNAVDEDEEDDTTNPYPWVNYTGIPPQYIQYARLYGISYQRYKRWKDEGGRTNVTTFKNWAKTEPQPQRGRQPMPGFNRLRRTIRVTPTLGKARLRPSTENIIETVVVPKVKEEFELQGIRDDDNKADSLCADLVMWYNTLCTTNDPDMFRLAVIHYGDLMRAIDEYGGGQLRNIVENDFKGTDESGYLTLDRQLEMRHYGNPKFGRIPDLLKSIAFAIQERNENNLPRYEGNEEHQPGLTHSVHERQFNGRVRQSQRSLRQTLVRQQAMETTHMRHTNTLPPRIMNLLNTLDLPTTYSTSLTSPGTVQQMKPKDLDAMVKYMQELQDLSNPDDWQHAAANLLRRLVKIRESSDHDNNPVPLRELCIALTSLNNSPHSLNLINDLFKMYDDYINKSKSKTEAINQAAELAYDIYRRYSSSTSSSSSSSSSSTAKK